MYSHKHRDEGPSLWSPPKGCGRGSLWGVGRGEDQGKEGRRGTETEPEGHTERGQRDREHERDLERKRGNRREIKGE